MEKEVNLKSKSKEEVKKFWQKKEEEIGESIQGKSIAEYMEGYQDFNKHCWGLLYYTNSAFYFQTFPRKNWLMSLIKSGDNYEDEKIITFKIDWKEVVEINLPPKKKSIFALFSPPDNRLFINYRNNSQILTMILSMYSRKEQIKFRQFFQHKGK